jgi:hypothetical protein
LPGTRVLNIGDPEPPSVAEIAGLIARHLRYQGAIVNGTDSGYPPMIGGSPWSVPRPLVVDTQAALRLGYIPATTYANAIPAICDWLVETAHAGDWREQFPGSASWHTPFDYAAEDRFLSNQTASWDAAIDFWYGSDWDHFTSEPWSAFEWIADPADQTVWCFGIAAASPASPSTNHSSRMSNSMLGLRPKMP